MPPKTQKPPGGRSKPAEEGKEDVLQAVIIADTFETTFRPFTLERPRCLLPLANTPLIEYTLRYLEKNGIQEVYVYAGAHADQVETYLEDSRWTSSISPFNKLEFLRCVNVTSVGDFMRDLDQKEYMVGDFIVINGDVVSDFPLEHALRQHKARREKDKNAIMTMVLRQSTQSRYDYEGATIPTFLLEPSKDRCHHYQENEVAKNFDIQLDPELLKIPELDLRQDLIDCRIDICTPDVLSLWGERFDNQHPRKDYLHGVLKDYELNGKTIHTYIVEDYYSARVGDLQSYQQITNDLKRRMVPPALYIENNVFSESHYSRTREDVLQDLDVVLARPTRLGKRTIAARDTTVGADSKIEDTIIGKRCTIGKGTSLKGAYLWDDVSIGNNVKINGAIVASEASIGDDCEIGEGALISYGVHIAAHTRVRPGARIRKSHREGVNGQTTVSTDHPENDGEGTEYENAEDSSTYRGPNLIYRRAEFATSASSLESETSIAPPSVGDSRSQSFGAGLSEEDIPDRFQLDTVNILLQRMHEGKHADDMLSELMGLRFSGGADENQVRNAVAVAMMKHISNQIDKGAATAANASKDTLQSYRTMIRREGAIKTTEEQVAFLLDVQKELVHRSEGAKILLHVSKYLYEYDVIEEEAFLEWWADERSTSDAGMSRVREDTSQFIEWLENAEEESEEDE